MKKNMKNKSQKLLFFLLSIPSFAVASTVDLSLEKHNVDSQISRSVNEKIKTSISQQKKITLRGNIVDAKKEPLIGVYILVKGSMNGTITDVNGDFSISISKGETLDISYIGYTPQNILIKEDQFLNVVMEESNETLDEIVVTALGIKRSEKALSYNVQQVKNDELTTVKDANFINSLNGKVAGVNIQRSSSGVGGGTRVVMRGNKSIMGDNNVLYVVI